MTVSEKSLPRSYCDNLRMASDTLFQYLGSSTEQNHRTISAIAMRLVALCEELESKHRLSPDFGDVIRIIEAAHLTNERKLASRAIALLNHEKFGATLSTEHPGNFFELPDGERRRYASYAAWCLSRAVYPDESYPQATD